MTNPTLPNRDVNRRSILKGAAASGLAAGLFGVASGPAHATPSQGGTFRVGVHDGSSTDSWDPATTASILMIHSSHVARAYLTEITNENTLGPDLATEWQGAEHGRQRMAVRPVARGHLP